MSDNFINPDEQSKPSDQLKNFRQTLLVLGKIIYPYRFSFLWGISLIFFSSVAIVFSGKFLGLLISQGISVKNKLMSLQYAIGLLILELSALLLNWWGRTILLKASSLSIHQVRLAMISHLQKLPISYFDKTPQGRLIVRLGHDIESVESFLNKGLGYLLTAFLTAIVTCLALVILIPFPGIFVAISSLPAWLFIFFTQKKLREIDRLISTSSAQVNAGLSENIEGIEVIKSYNLENWSLREFQKKTGLFLKNYLKALKFFITTRPVLGFVCGLPVVVALGLGGLMSLQGTLETALAIALLRYAENFYRPLMELGMEVLELQNALTNVERFSLFLETPADKDLTLTPSTPIPLKDIKGSILFKSVSFRYGKNSLPALQGLSFSIKAGEKIGIVGATGSGKTTTISLLARLYDFQEGEILIDEHPLSLFSKENIPELIGMVSQEAVIFASSIWNNLCLGKKFDKSHVEKIAQETGLIESLNRSQKTLYSSLYEGGKDLSTGQRQILALTRVLLHGGKIIILDEATSNIDHDSEQLIKKALNNFFKHQTCLIVAHRLETLQSCDRIFFFKEGKLLEERTSLSAEEFIQLKNNSMIE